MRSEQEGAGDLDDLLAQVDDILVNQGIAASSERQQSLTAFLTAISRIATEFAQARRLHTSTRSSAPDATSGEEWQERRLAVRVARRATPKHFRFIGSNAAAQTIVLLVDGDEVWRGETATDSSFTTRSTDRPG